MAREMGTPRKRRTTVPVTPRAAHSSQDSAASRRRGTSGAAGRRSPDRMDIVGIGVLIFVVLIILMAISVPLRNYYTGRTEIARLNESIDAKQAEKERLLGDIDKYKSDDYAEQEARRRLGVIAQGETAYRILDPGMTPENSLTTDKKTETDDREWYQVLWDSVAEDTTSDNVDTGNRPDADAKDTPAEPGAESEIQHAVEDAIEQQGGQLGGQPAQQ